MVQPYPRRSLFKKIEFTLHEDASSQNTEFLANWFLRKRILNIFFYILICKNLTHPIVVQPHSPGIMDYWFLRTRYFSIFLCKKRPSLNLWPNPTPKNLNYDLYKLESTIPQDDTIHTSIHVLIFSPPLKNQ